MLIAVIASLGLKIYVVLSAYLDILLIGILGRIVRNDFMKSLCNFHAELFSE